MPARSARAIACGSRANVMHRSRRSADMMTPELPRAPKIACRPTCIAVSSNSSRSPSTRSPSTRSPSTCSSDRMAPQAASQVRYKLVPVSPSGTGNTLRASISTRASRSEVWALRSHSRSMGRVKEVPPAMLGSPLPQDYGHTWAIVAQVLG